MSTILDLAPQNVWKHFYSLTQIPRPSGHMEKITEFLVNFGNSLGLKTFVDDAGNVIIRKPATPGMENRKGVILQAHMDMVPQKNNDTVHDFEKDPIETYIDGEWVKAKGTTLGADNGLGVAAIMAVLEDQNLKHGPLEALITKDEETGMYGAFGLKPGTVNGEILLNLDSEDEGELYIGCAGGMDVTASLEYKEVAPEEGDIAIRVNLKGLRGGHSGLEINQGRANANKLLVRFIREAVATYEARLASWEGGNMRNAIPREAHAVVTIPAENEEEFGNDPILIYQGDMWLGGKFLNIIFHQYLPRSEKHRISLVQNKIEPEAPETPEALNVDEDGYIHLELRYNTYDDVTGYRGWGRVSYNLEEFYPTAKDAAETEFKGFKVTINSKENGEGRVIVLDLDHPVGVPEKAKDVHSTSFVK